MRFGPPYPLEGLQVPLPCVCVLLAFTVKPAGGASHGARRCYMLSHYPLWRNSRDVRRHASSPFSTFPLSKVRSCYDVPNPKLVDPQTQPLTVGAPLHLEVVFLGLAAVRLPFRLRPNIKDRHIPKIPLSRGYGSDSGHTPFTSLCSRIS